MYANS